MHFATTADEVRVATDAALGEAEALVVAAIATGGRGTFATVLLPLDEADARIAAGYATGAFMARVHVDPAVRDAGQEAEERLDRWRVDLPFREDLAATIFAFAASPEAAGLEGEPRRLLDRLLRDLRRAGHGLDAATRAEVRRLEGRLVELSSAFQRNIDEFEDGLDLTRDELDGLDDDFVAGLRPGAGARHVPGHPGFARRLPVHAAGAAARPAPGVRASPVQRGARRERAAPGRGPRDPSADCRAPGVRIVGPLRHRGEDGGRPGGGARLL